MKKFIILFGLIGLVYATNAQNYSLTKIVIFRENRLKGVSTAYNIYMDDSLVLRMNNNTFYTFICKPGQHTFTVNKFQHTTLTVNVEQGKTYYLQFSFRWVSGTGIPQLSLTESDKAESIMNGSLKKWDKHTTPLITSKNRIGITINLGGGFSNETLARSSTGANASISFGGGYAIGLKYGHQYSERLDVAFDLNYQFSELTPTVTNADVTFSRGILSITPSYIIPIHGGYRMRVKVGGGADYYFKSELSIQTAKIQNGFNDTWTYKKTFGYHLSAVYEFILSSRWSINAGLKGYLVSYSFSSGNSYKPTSKKLSNPNGSGLDLMAGINYHF